MSSIVIKTFHSGVMHVTNAEKKSWKYDGSLKRWYYWVGPDKGQGFWEEIREPPNYIKDAVFTRLANKGNNKKKKGKEHQDKYEDKARGPGFWERTFGVGDSPMPKDMDGAEVVPPAPVGFPPGTSKGGVRQDFKTKEWSQPVHECKHWRVPIAVGEHKVFVSARRSCPADLKDVPFAGLYLDWSWKTVVEPTALSAGTTVPGMGARYDAVFLEWPDMAVFRDFPTLEASLKWLMTYARKGQMADIGCVGSHGRTGTALACLLVMEEGLTAEEAIKAVRKRHCQRCIETDRQEAMIDSFYKFLRKQGKGA